MSAEDRADKDVLEEVERLIAALRGHPDSGVRAQVEELLAGIDAVHRLGLTRLVAGIQTMAGEAFLSRLCGDPAVRLLLMSYGLVAVDRRLQAEEALDAVRGHLHSRGVDVELRDVVGGVVYVRLHGLAASGLEEEAVRRDLEAALNEGLLGLQELVIGDRPAAPGAATVIPAASLKRAQRPVYRRLADEQALSPGALMAVEAGEQSLLLARVDGDVHAVANRCGDSPLPLHFSRLEGAVVVCSWHGCRWDVRTGGRVDGGEGRLPVFPARLSEGGIEVAVGVAPAAAP